MPALNELNSMLAALSDSSIAAHSCRFFKTGPGEYGEGDRFLGIRVPELRKLVSIYSELPMDAVRQLLSSPWHEKRLLAALMLVDRFRKGDEKERQMIFNLYLEHTPSSINNWDIIDTTCPHIVGAWLEERDRSILYTLAGADNIWQRRLAVLACFYFIRNNDHADGLEIAEILLRDREDLIHKASGWMLREIGKRDPAAAERFLRQHCTVMPRTMLRYAIERLEPGKRQRYLDARKLQNT